MQKLFKEYATTLGLVWLGSFILLFFVYMLVLKPQARLKRQLSDDLNEKQQDYMAAYETSQEKVRKRLLLEVEHLENNLREFVTDSDESANLTFDISRIANDNNVLSFSIKARDNKGLFEVPGCSLIGENRFDVSFDGDFGQFAMFLNALERHQPVVFIDNFSVTKNSHSTASSSVKMAVSVFVEKEKSS